MIDLHSHLLPGIDDGTRTPEEALAMARAMLADGVTTVAATPHVREDFPTTSAQMRRALEELCGALAAARLPLTVLPGGEIAYSLLGELDEGELAAFGLGGNPRLLLVELPAFGLPLDLLPRVAGLHERGFTTVIAHPERHPDLIRAPQLLHELVRVGVVLQVTAAALDGRLGRGQRSAAMALVDEGLAHLIGSDAHRPGVRAAGMRGAATALRNEALARWLTEEVPAALLRSDPVPPRPPTRRRFGLLRR